MFSRQERVLLGLLAVIQFAHILDFIIMMPLGPYLMRMMNIHAQEFGYVVSAYTFSAGLFGILAATIVDRFDRRVALRTAFAGFTLGTLACAIAPNYEFLLLARILAGAFGGVVGSLVLSIIGDQIPLERRATAMGIVMAAFSVTSVAGVPLGLVLADWWQSWNAPFYLIGGISLLLLPAIQWLLPPMAAHLQSRVQRPSPLAVLGQIVARRNQRNALLLTITVLFGQFLVVPYISPYMVHNVGFAETDVKYIYVVGGFVTIFTAPLIGRLADRRGHRRVFQWFAFLSLGLFGALTNLPPVSLVVALTVTALFFIVSGGRGIPMTTLVTSAVPPAIRGGFMSVNSAVQSLAMGAATITAGLMVGEGPQRELLHFEWVGALAIGTTLVAVWLVAQVRPYQAPVPPPSPAEASVGASEPTPAPTEPAPLPVQP